MTNNRALDNQLREKVLAEVMDFFRKNEEDVLQTNSNECVFPCLDSEGNEKWIQIVVKVPTGGREEEGFDGYGVAESYQLKLKEKEEKKKANEEKKAKKIERDRKIREKKKEKGEQFLPFFYLDVLRLKKGLTSSFFSVKIFIENKRKELKKMSLILVFILLSIINVIFSTVRSLTTIKSGKTVASLISGGYFAFYNIVLIYTVMDFPMWEKCIITFVCNVIGVFIVKLIEEKMRKDKMWKVEVTIPTRYSSTVDFELEKVPHSYIKISDKHTLFNFYCATQEETKRVTDICKTYDAKFFASECQKIFQRIFAVKVFPSFFP